MVGWNYYLASITKLHPSDRYRHHEEQYLTNSKDMVLTNYDTEII
jgi:hypothetical protein